MCLKVCYQSKKAARRGNRHASFDFRVYWCDDCCAYHVANRGKS